MKKLLLFLLGLCLVSCYFPRLATTVSYRSFSNRDETKQEIASLSDIPTTAKIAIGIEINESCSSVDVIVYNLTDETMSIDRTQSFFLYPTSQTAYFDPTVQTYTTTSGNSSGASVNLGSVAQAVGVGGVIGGVLGGVNVGGSSLSSSSTTTYRADTPIIHIPPKGSASMGRSFDISNITNNGAGFSYDEYNQCVFGVCIAYSTDRLSTIDNFISTYKMDDFIIERVPMNGTNNCYYVNDALRRIYITKPNLFSQRCYVLTFSYDQGYYSDEYFSSMPLLFDYK